jgi:hypothetical protein
MKAAGIVFPSICIAVSLCGCAPTPVDTVDPLQISNASSNFQTFEERDKALRERWLAQGR